MNFKRTIKNTHCLLEFDSLESLLKEAERENHRTDRITPELFDTARKGMTVEGVQSLTLALEKINNLEAELPTSTFEMEYGEFGDEVDMSRYYAGDPDPMSSAVMVQTHRSDQIISLVLSVSVSSMIPASAIAKHGVKVMAIVEAIELAGMQAEIYIECNAQGRDDYSIRTKVCLKSAGETYDPARFMFALTNENMLRGLILNAMHQSPKKFHTPMKIGWTYGAPTQKFLNPEDYPEGSVFIPSIKRDSDADNDDLITNTLKELNLI